MLNCGHYFAWVIARKSKRNVTDSLRERERKIVCVCTCPDFDPRFSAAKRTILENERRYIYITCLFSLYIITNRSPRLSRIIPLPSTRLWFFGFCYFNETRSRGRGREKLFISRQMFFKGSEREKEREGERVETTKNLCCFFVKIVSSFSFSFFLNHCPLRVSFREFVERLE